MEKSNVQSEIQNTGSESRLQLPFVSSFFKFLNNHIVMDASLKPYITSLEFLAFYKFGVLSYKQNEILLNGGIRSSFTFTFNSKSYTHINCPFE